jgi:hypothetical protein
MMAWDSRSDADWSLLSGGSRALFGHAPLSTYAQNPGLQIGAPALAVVRTLNVLPGIGGELAAHLLLGFMGWLMVFLAERWSVAGATFFTAPVRPGLLTILVGIPVLKEWAALAGAFPHIEDGLALLTFVLASRAVTRSRPVAAGVLVGLTAAWKPWAVVALPLLWGLPHRRRSVSSALAIAIAIPAACWLPFVVGDHATLHAISANFSLRAESPLQMLGFRGDVVPSWWRSIELLGALAAASVAALRRDWRSAFAAGCAARLLLDPAGFGYYVAGVVMATAIAERLCALRPWRTALLLITLVYVNPLLSTGALAQVRFLVLTLLVVSWLSPWRRPLRGRSGNGGPQRAASIGIPGPRNPSGRAESPAEALVKQGRLAQESLVVPPEE